MGGIMGGAPKPQAPDTSYLDEQRAQADKDRAKLEAENKAKRSTLRARRSGRQSLLFQDTRGVTDGASTLKTTLGA